MDEKQIPQKRKRPIYKDGERGMEMDIPSNYENSLVGTPKDLTNFEVSRSPGRLG
jgi:hypothetical protein